MVMSGLRFVDYDLFCKLDVRSPLVKPVLSIRFE